MDTKQNTLIVTHLLLHTYCYTLHHNSSVSVCKCFSVGMRNVSCSQIAIHSDFNNSAH